MSEAENNNANDPVQALLSQLEASKQMYNESINSMFQLRTQAIHLQKMNADLQNQLKQAKENLATANAKIEELSNPQTMSAAAAA